MTKTLRLLAMLVLVGLGLVACADILGLEPLVETPVDGGADAADANANDG